MRKLLKSLLVIGGPATGKTHYGGQLLGRLNKGDNCLRMIDAPSNISPFEEVLKRLGQGMTAGHTATEIYDEVKLPIERQNGEKVELVFPDYGGEQVRTMMEQRQVSIVWRNRLRESGGWLLFIRLDRIRAYEDLLSRPRGREAPQTIESPEDFKWSDQAYYIELLQLLLYAKGVGVVKRVKDPTLCVVLSCWDELGEDVTKGVSPATLLSRRMPLLGEFISSIWTDSYVNVLGLSALGKALREKEPDEDYMDYGPENFGYVVLPDGSLSQDLTLPLALTMERLP